MKRAVDYKGLAWNLGVNVFIWTETSLMNLLPVRTRTQLVCNISAETKIGPVMKISQHQTEPTPHVYRDSESTSDVRKIDALMSAQ